jgi:hypothetical protein
MKTKIITITVLISVLTYAVNSRAIISAQILSVPQTSQSQFTTIAFSDSAEAGMMHRAYKILATGDHDYKGHRAKAMKQVKDAADLLGLDLRGDDKDKEKQFLSDEKLSEARGLLEKVLGAAEVKDQKHITKHLDAAIAEINKALSLK